MTGASITLVTGANVTGRLLAETGGAVTLDTNVITVPAACSAVTTTGAASTTTTGLINDATLAAPTGNEVAGASFHDTSTVVGASGVATGTVTYGLFANGTCTGTPVRTDAATIAVSGAVPNSTTTGPLPAGSYSFDATYSGDATYLSGVSACEPFVVLPPAVITPPVTPPAVITPPVTPPAVVTPAVTPPVVVTPAVTPPAVTPAPVAPATSSTGTAGSGSGTGAVAGSGSSTAGSGSSGTTTATPSVVLPVGAPSTGFGGAARSGDNELLVALGAAALFGAAVATGLAMRRRRLIDGPAGTNLEAK